MDKVKIDKVKIYELKDNELTGCSYEYEDITPMEAMRYLHFCLNFQEEDINSEIRLLKYILVMNYFDKIYSCRAF